MLDKKLVITLEYAKWKEEWYKKKLDSVPSHMRFPLRCMHSFWRNIHRSLCPHPKFVEDDNDVSPMEYHKCISCGITRMEACELTLDRSGCCSSCDTCKFYFIEGGDFVPYGSTNVQLPITSGCELPLMEDLGPDSIDKWDEDHMRDGGIHCPLWRGKEIK